jgi:hypothetical protein
MEKDAFLIYLEYNYPPYNELLEESIFAYIPEYPN